MNVLQFQEKVLDIQDNMFHFALLLTGNSNDANDLLQDTTLRALDNQEKYTNNVNFRGWMLTIMRNIFINNYRKVIRSQTLIDQTVNLYHLDIIQDSGFDSPDSAYTIKEINNAIGQLSYELKITFSLFLAGYKYNEIAEKMVLPKGTVKSRIFSARQELQRNLQGMKE